MVWVRIPPSSAIYKCIDCGKQVDKKALRCVKCNSIYRRKVKNRPSKKQLIKEVTSTSYLAIGRKYGVSDTSIRKWIKAPG